MGQCSCSGVEPILWGSDGGTDFLVRLCRRRWSVVVRGRLERGVEEALLFEGRSGEIHEDVEREEAYGFGGEKGKTNGHSFLMLIEAERQKKGK